MKHIVSGGLAVLIFFYAFFPLPVRAEYVLPYPSYMPGNKLYTIAKIFEKIEAWWYWGSIGQIKYHMKLSDKYLVEAKTLFEYKQYILALRALHASDEHMLLIPGYLAKGEQAGKDVRAFLSDFAAQKELHMQVLSRLAAELPKTFVWTPEKEPATTLDLSGELSHSITLRSR